MSKRKNTTSTPPVKPQERMRLLWLRFVQWYAVQPRGSKPPEFYQDIYRWNTKKTLPSFERIMKAVQENIGDPITILQTLSPTVVETGAGVDGTNTSPPLV